MDATAAPSFEGLGTDEQVEVLRRVALDAAPAFGLAVERLELVLHGFNTTFALDEAGGRRLALRVNTNSLSTPAQLAAQQAWVHAIATETDVAVPDAVPTTAGEPFATVRSAAAGRDFRVVVNTWLAGDDVGVCDERRAHALGRAMATLHRQAAGWRPPPGTGLMVFDEPLLGDENRVEGHPRLDARGRAVVAEALERARAAFATALAGAARIPVHGDLHGGNLKWHEGRLAVFDFDDSGLAVPALDLAVATFYLRGRGQEPVEAALRSGYAEVAPLPEPAAATFEALVAARQLLLANSLLTSSTPEFRAMLPEYLERTVRRLEHWLGSGRFTLDPP
jgi:Ser/Thr protein kinase RdoA (MazF antagonist)